MPLNHTPSIVDMEKREYVHKIINLIKECNEAESKEQLHLNSSENIDISTLDDIECSCPLGSIPGFDLGRIFNMWTDFCSVPSKKQQINIAIGCLNMDDILHEVGDEYIKAMEDE